ncbi:MAG: hypothetical protein AUK03_12960 [Anaerolineae bacterium CG2_30_64_16]|nr:MAG: hypothetical protein AUK03_12960 [Anaerolineae bacterium CG2_30_64_16]
MSEKEHRVGLEVEERPEGLFDLLWLTLPVPRLSLFFPKEMRQHLRAARREHLLAVRSLLDKAIERLEETEKPPRKAERVKIE